jgi:hypothetical protein
VGLPAEPVFRNPLQGLPGIGHLVVKFRQKAFADGHMLLGFHWSFLLGKIVVSMIQAKLYQIKDLYATWGR